MLSTDGTVLAAGGETGAVTSGKALDLEKQVSREIDENIRKTLVPFLGLGNFEASVSARLNLDKKQISETAFDPESKVERSTKTIKESGSSQNAAANGMLASSRTFPAATPVRANLRNNRARATSGRKRSRTSR